MKTTMMICNQRVCAWRLAVQHFHLPLPLFPLWLFFLPSFLSLYTVSASTHDSSSHQQPPEPHCALAFVCLVGDGCFLLDETKDWPGTNQGGKGGKGQTRCITMICTEQGQKKRGRENLTLGSSSSTLTTAGKIVKGQKRRTGKLIRQQAHTRANRAS